MATSPMQAASVSIPTSPAPSLTRQLARLSIPMIGISASRMLMGFTDFAMVSGLGTAAQAALSPASILVFAVMAIGLGAAGTVQTFASQADGRGEAREGSAYAWQGIYFALISTIFIFPIAWAMPAFYHRVGDYAGTSPEVIRLQIEFSVAAVWSFTPAVICASLEGFFNGLQRGRVALVAILVSLVANAIGNYIFIYGKFGFPAYGVQGSAISTVIAWWVHALILGWVFLSSEFNRTHFTRTAWMPDIPKLLGIVRIGIPAAMQWLVEIGAWAVFLMVTLPAYGTAALAASNIAIQLLHVSFMPAGGVGMALCSLVGFSIGERRLDRAEEVTATAEKISVAYMGFIGLLFILGRRTWIGLFSADPAVIDAGSAVLILCALVQIFDALMITYTNALRGAGDTRWPAIVMGLACWTVFVGGGYAVMKLAPQWGVAGPWITVCIYFVIVGLALRWRFRSCYWHSIQLFQKPEAEVGAAAAIPAGAITPADPA